MSLTCCRIFSFKSTAQYIYISWRVFTNSLEIPAPSSDRRICVYASILCVYWFLCVSGPHLSIFLPSSWRCRMEEKRGGRVSYSGKQRLKQLSKHCQQCSWALEKDLPLLLCVLYEVTHWRLWFLSWTQTLALHHPSWCTTGSDTVSNINLTNEWLI